VLDGSPFKESLRTLSTYLLCNSGVDARNMRQNTVFAALFWCQLALAAPIPAIFVQGLRLEAVARLSAPTGGDDLQAAPIPEPDAKSRGEGGAVYRDINKPQMPAPEEDSSSVLSAARPVVTEYLLSLAPKPGSDVGSAPTARSHTQPLVLIQESKSWTRLRGGGATLTKDTKVFADPYTVVQVNIEVSDADRSDDEHWHRGHGHGRRRHHRMGHWRHRHHKHDCASRLAREYHDMLVISLVVVFLFVVVAWEMWETLCAR
jgi:hypothetical protein